jgi:hypothetical protein
LPPESAAQPYIKKVLSRLGNVLESRIRAITTRSGKSARPTASAIALSGQQLDEQLTNWKDSKWLISLHKSARPRIFGSSSAPRTVEAGILGFSSHLAAADVQPRTGVLA